MCIFQIHYWLTLYIFIYIISSRSRDYLLINKLDYTSNIFTCTLLIEILTESSMFWKRTSNYLNVLDSSAMFSSVFVQISNSQVVSSILAIWVLKQLLRPWTTPKKRREVTWLLRTPCSMPCVHILSSSHRFLATFYQSLVAWMSLKIMK